jgi:hypothetical protein
MSTGLGRSEKGTVTVITSWDASALLDLQTHWEGAYTVALIDDVWRATSVDTLEILEADTSTELREKMRNYYAELKARQ